MVKIRLADPERDAARAAEIYRPAVVGSTISFEEKAPDAREMAARMRTVLTRTPWLVATDEDGRVVGYAYAGEHRSRAGYRWSVDISVYVDPAAQRRGIGRALYAELLPILRRQGFVNAYAGIGLPNPASVRLHESIGMTPRRRLRTRRLEAGPVGRRCLVRPAPGRAFAGRGSA